jgi:hypothetical protein
MQVDKTGFPPVDLHRRGDFRVRLPEGSIFSMTTYRYITAEELGIFSHHFNTIVYLEETF